MKPEKLITNSDKLEYLKAVYGIEKDELFNKLIVEIIEDEIIEAYGGYSNVNQHDADYIQKRIYLLLNNKKPSY